MESTMKSITTLIIGAGIAGITAAKAVVQQGSSVIIAGSEPYLPYYRPRLIEVLSLGRTIDGLLIHKPEWFKANGLEVLLSKTAQRIDNQNKITEFSDGTKIHYDNLIIACGSVANKPSLPVNDAVFTLRNYDDARAINTACNEKGNAFIVGGGILGIETAFALLTKGIKVAIAERSNYLLSRQLDPKGGEFLKGLIEHKGIKIHVNADFLALQDEMQKAAVITASGVTPDVGFLKKSGIAANRGIIVDAAMRTSLQDVFACGDIAEFSGSVPGLMPVAIKQGEAAGISAVGKQAVYTQPILSPLLKVADIPVMSVGSIKIDDDTTVLRYQDDKSYCLVVLGEGRIKGAALIGNTSAGTKLKAAVENKKVFTSTTSVKDLLLKL